MNTPNPRRLIAAKTLGSTGLEPYQILGQEIKYNIRSAKKTLTELAYRSGWHWQTLVRIVNGERRTDLVELIIIANLVSENQEEAEKLILKWSRLIMESIDPDILANWRRSPSDPPD